MFEKFFLVVLQPEMKVFDSLLCEKHEVSTMAFKAQVDKFPLSCY